MPTCIKKDGTRDKIGRVAPVQLFILEEGAETMDFLERYKQARETLKPYLLDYVQSITAKSKGRNMFACPLCGSGTGKSKTGAFSVYANKHTYKCFSCGASGDIIDLYKALNGITEEKAAVKELCASYGVEYPNTDGTETAEPRPKPKPIIKEVPEEEPETDFSDFIRTAAEHITQTDYWKKRGLSEETAKRFSLGYVAEWKHPKAPTAPTSPRLIIPISAYSYTARDTRETLTKEQSEYKKQKVKGKEGANWIFNRKALTASEQPIFVVEGEIDAISIAEVGGVACGLGSTANVKQFLRECEGRQPKQPLIICLDNDTSGQKAQEELAEGLKQLHISFYRRDINGAYKDANERLTADRDGLTKAVKDIIAEVEQMEQERRATEPTATADTKSTLAEQEQKAEEQAKRQMQNGKKPNTDYIYEFMGHIAEFANTPEQTTGFSNLDKALDGGLYEGLYCIGAISSLGKTALVLQVCDQIASTGTHILFFSLEMARLELMARSISRESFLLAYSEGNTELAKDVRHIMNGKLWKKYTEQETSVLQDAIAKYSRYANNIFIQEGVGDITVKRITDTVKEHIAEHHKKPVVVLDYLQIIAPNKEDEGKTDKQITDKCIVGLKRLARDEKLTILAISSFNRENYTEPVGYSSFKESGAIEYSCDVLMGMQYKGMDYKTQTNGKGEEVTESATQHIARIRKLTAEYNKAAARGESVPIELKILKNRNGFKSVQYFNYYPKYNMFSESSEEKTAAPDTQEGGQADTKGLVKRRGANKY